MFLFGAAVAWGGYTLTWWGWLCLKGKVGSGMWPSFLDLVKPGKDPLSAGVPGADLPSTLYNFGNSTAQNPADVLPPQLAPLVPNAPGGLSNPGTPNQGGIPANNPIPYLPGLIS